MLLQWQMTGIESGKVVTCVQNYTIRSAKKQGYFPKLCFKMLSKWHVTGTESGKVVKCLHKCIIRSAKKQG